MENENKTSDAVEKTGCCGGGDKKQECCIKKGTCTKLLFGGLVGGVVMFAYYLLARRFLPWHEKELISFANARISFGHMQASITQSHTPDIQYFILCFVGAVVLTHIIKKAGCPVYKSMLIGILVAIFGHMPNVIYFHMPLHNALAGMFNDFVALSLAGFAIASLVLKTGGCKMGHSCCGGKGDDKSGCCGEGKDSDKKGCCH